MQVLLEHSNVSPQSRNCRKVVQAQTCFAALPLHPQLQTLRIRKRFDHIAAVNNAALLDPAIETRTIVQRQINRQAE